MVRTGSVLVVSLLLATSADAHHGFGTFDLNQSIELSGVITRLDFINPHSWLYMDVARDNGEVASYRCEMRSATTLRRSGWSPDMFRAGEPITVMGSPDRRDPNSCYVSTLVFADGSGLDRYGQRTSAQPAAAPVERELRLANGELNITGDWAPEQMVMTDSRGQRGTLVPLSTVKEFAPGEVPSGEQVIAGSRGAAPAPAARRSLVQLTEAGAAASASFTAWTDEDPRLSCEMTSILFDWTPGGGPINRITQTGDTITMEYGQVAVTRTIHMDLSEHPANIEPSRAGHSIGQWENDVLVVDTVGFLAGVLAPPTLHSNQLHVVERFSFDPKLSALTRTFVAKDPLFFVGEYTGSDVVYPSTLAYSPDACKDLTLLNYSEKAAE